MGVGNKSCLYRITIIHWGGVRTKQLDPYLLPPPPPPPLVPRCMPVPGNLLLILLPNTKARNFVLVENGGEMRNTLDVPCSTCLTKWCPTTAGGGALRSLGERGVLLTDRRGGILLTLTLQQFLPEGRGATGYKLPVRACKSNRADIKQGGGEREKGCHTISQQFAWCSFRSIRVTTATQLLLQKLNRNPTPPTALCAFMPLPSERYRDWPALQSVGGKRAYCAKPIQKSGVHRVPSSRQRRTDLFQTRSYGKA